MCQCHTLTLGCQCRRFQARGLVKTGATNNARPENEGRSEMHAEIAGLENATSICRGGKCGIIEYGKLMCE